MLSQECSLHWDNTPVNTAASVVGSLAAKGEKMVSHPPYLPDLAPADFFLFSRVKEKLAWPDLDAGELQEQLGGSCQIHRH